MRTLYELEKQKIITRTYKKVFSFNLYKIKTNFKGKVEDFSGEGKRESHYTKKIPFDVVVADGNIIDYEDIRSDHISSVFMENYYFENIFVLKKEREILVDKEIAIYSPNKLSKDQEFIRKGLEYVLQREYTDEEFIESEKKKNKNEQSATNISATGPSPLEDFENFEKSFKLKWEWLNDKNSPEYKKMQDNLKAERKKDKILKWGVALIVIIFILIFLL